MRKGIDFNASSQDRVRRNWQQIKKGTLTPTIGVTLPLTNNGSTLGLLVDPAGALSTGINGLGVHVGSTGSTLLSTGVGGINLIPHTSTTIFSGPATGAAAIPTFRALSTFVDNSTITVTGSGVLQAVASTLTTPIVAGDGSIHVGTSTGSTTIAVVDSSTGGISTAATGIALKLSSTSGMTQLLFADFTALATSTQLGTIGGSGSTWWVANNTFQPEIPDNTQVNSAFVEASTGSMVSAVASGAAQAQYVPTLALGSHYVIAAVAAPIGTAGFAQACGLFVRGDKTAHAASQGVALIVFTNRINLTDVNGGGLLGSTAVTLTAGAFISMSLEVNGNSFTGTVNGNVVTGTSANNATNQGVGFWNGSSGVAPDGFKNFSVSTIIASPTFPGLFTDVSGVGVLCSSTGGLSAGSTGLAVVPSSTGGISTGTGGLALITPATGGLSTGTTGLSIHGLPIVSADPGSPADGDVWYNSTNNGFAGQVSGFTFGNSMVMALKTSGNAVVNTTVQTISITFGTIPANFLKVGMGMRVKFAGSYSCNLSANLSVGLYLGSVAVDGNPAFAATVGAAGANFGSESSFLVTATGTNGAVITFGNLLFDTTVHNFAPAFANPSGINTTGTLVLTIKLTWSAASAGNNAIVNVATAEFLPKP